MLSSNREVIRDSSYLIVNRNTRANSSLINPICNFQTWPAVNSSHLHWEMGQAKECEFPLLNTGQIDCHDTIAFPIMSGFPSIYSTAQYASSHSNKGLGPTAFAATALLQGTKLALRMF